MVDVQEIKTTFKVGLNAKLHAKILVSSPSGEMYTSPKNRIMHNSCFSIFFLDTVSGTYMMFVYSGCGGSENSFFTSDECQKECKR
ncbi:hypothetical protein E2320_007568, partial [Naja naja]